jgi:ATP-binding cassette subfamily F protein 3
MKKMDFEGTVGYGHNVNVTYFAQDQADSLNTNKTVFETVDDVAKGEIRKELRTILGTFLFSNDDTEKKVGVLSGGERTRLALCQLLLSPSNFLILDEPTNHLDIQSKEVLKQALINYEGTFIIVSHDREFLQDLTNRIWDIENQELKIHHFSLDEYINYKMIQNPEESKKSTNLPKSDSSKKNNNTGNQHQISNRSSIQKEIQFLEKEISSYEDEIKKLDESISNFDFESDEGKKLWAKYQEIQDKLKNLMKTWEEKNILLEDSSGA